MHRGQSRAVVFIPFVLILRGFYQSTVQPRYKLSFEVKEFSNASYELHQTSSDDSFTIQTTGCFIPTLDYLDPSMKSFVQYSTNISACPHSAHPLLDNNKTHVWVVKRNLKYFGRRKLRCCYSGIEVAESGSSVTYKECITFDSTIAATDDFVRVTCNVPLEQFFTFAPKIRRNQGTAFHISENPLSYNVLILGIRSLSRQNFQRTMPKTLSLLKSKKSIDMMGYNKVSENGILVHVLAMLLGMTEKDLKKTCLPNSVSTLDKCPFIWGRFKDIGYYTALMEDSSELSVFNLNNDGYYGFKTKPTDYYLHPIIKESERCNRKLNAQECIGNKYSYQVVLDYIENLTSALKYQKLFGVFWESSMSLQYTNQPMLMDDRYEALIKNLDQTGYLNNTILILMSDQGVKYGDVYETKQRQMNERLPFLNILVPPSFRTKFSLAYENLKANARRLSTPFDIYNTLVDLIDLNGLKNEEVLLRSTIIHPHDKRFSLFLPIPGNRTCVSANISSTLCSCFESHAIEKNSVQARGATTFLMNFLNKMLSPYPQCAQLMVDVTIQALELMVSYEKYQEWRDVAVVVRVTPGGGVFEGTVRHYKQGGWAMGSTIRRLNPHDDQARCVHLSRLKMYCYCIN